MSCHRKDYSCFKCGNNGDKFSGNMIELSLFGPRAQEFDGDTIYEVGQNSHVIAIFVGTSMKQYKGSPPFLSGTAACRWYINENVVTEIRDFYK